MAINSVRIQDAADKLSELLARVEAGETITVTRCGTPVALLTPVAREVSPARRAIVRLRALRGGALLNGLKIEELRDEGRP